MDPQHRGQPTTILRLALVVARERCGTERLLLTCDDDNIAAIRTIERNGGILEDVVHGPDLARPLRRYWSDLGRPCAR